MNEYFKIDTSYFDYLRHLRTDQFQKHIFVGEIMASVAKPQLSDGELNYLILVTKGQNVVIVQVECKKSKIGISSITHISDSILASSECYPLLDNEKAKSWWELCYRKNSTGRITYDKYYDCLPMSENSEQTIGYLNEDIHGIISKLNIQKNSNIFMFGEWNDDVPVLYAFQESFEANVKTMNLPLVENIRRIDNVEIMFTSSVFLCYYSEDGVTPISFNYGYQYSFDIACYTLDSPTFLFGGYTFRDLIPKDVESTDYIINNCSYQRIYIISNSDAMGNEFINISYSNGIQCTLIIENKKLNVVHPALEKVLSVNK